jgi:hypothetical protein
MADFADQDSPGQVPESPAQRGEAWTTVDTVVAAGQMLASPRKCKIWHESWLKDGLTIKQLTAATSIPQSTVYDLTREMVEEGSLYAAGTTDNNASILKPTSMQIFVSEHPENIGHQFNIHSTLIGVVGRGTEYEEIETFLDRNNYTMLVESITGVLSILSEPDLEATSLDELFEGMDVVDAQLIQGHIAAVLQREAKKPGIDWTFPDEPVISPIE